MKVLHCSNIFLDAKLPGLTPDKEYERQQEFITAFKNMVKTARQEKVRAILISGNLFDSTKISEDAKNCVLNAAEESPEITWFYLQGEKFCNNFFDEEIPKNFITFTNQWTSHYLSDKVCVTGIELDEENKNSACETLKLNPEKFNIIMMCGREDTDNKVKSLIPAINIKDFKNKHIGYLALGYYDGYKCGQLEENAKACYPGCLEARNADNFSKHGFVLLDIDETDGKSTVNLISNPIRKSILVNVDISNIENINTIEENINDQLEKNKATKNDFVKIILTGSADLDNMIDTDAIVKRYNNQFYIFKIEDNVSYVINSAKYENDKSLKGEFIRTVTANSELTQNERVRIIKQGLEALVNGGSN